MVCGAGGNWSTRMKHATCKNMQTRPRTGRQKGRLMAFGPQPRPRDLVAVRQKCGPPGDVAKNNSTKQGKKLRKPARQRQMTASASVGFNQCISNDHSSLMFSNSITSMFSVEQMLRVRLSGIHMRAKVLSQGPTLAGGCLSPPVSKCPDCR